MKILIKIPKVFKNSQKWGFSCFFKIDYSKVITEMRKPKKNEGNIRPHSEQQPEKPNKISICFAFLKQIKF